MVSKFFETAIDMAQQGVAQLPEPTVEDKINAALRKRDEIAGQIGRLASTGNFGEEIIGYDDFGSPIMGQSGDSKQIAALADAYDILGAQVKLYAADDGLGGATGGGGGISATALAQIAQQDRVLAENIRQFNMSFEQGNQQFAESMAFNREELATTQQGAMDRLVTQLASEEKRAQAQLEQQQAELREQQRANNLSSTLDMLTNQIRTGELGVAEASNRISAATNAANIQRDILSDHAGKALPAGATHYPNLGAGGPIAAMASALGQPFVPFETMGTFAIDPNAIAAPISSAPGMSVMPGMNEALAAAAATLANLGVPPPTGTPTGTRPPQIGQQAAARALAGM